MRTRYTVLLGAAAALLIGCDSPTSPVVQQPEVEPPNAESLISRHFNRKLPLWGFWVADGPAPPPVPPTGLCREGALGATIHTYSGWANHFGRFTMEATLCAFTPDFTAYEGTAQLTTADGAVLEMAFFDGTVVSVQPPYIFMRDEVRFTGGTRRFANVTGGGYDFIRFDTTVGYGRALLHGWIRYGARKPAPTH